MKFFKRKKAEMPYVVERSNVIQFDEMGYPLRYCIMSDKEHLWIDSVERTGDVILRWNLDNIDSEPPEKISVESKLIGNAIDEIERVLVGNKSRDTEEVYLRNALQYLTEVQQSIDQKVI